MRAHPGWPGVCITLLKRRTPQRHMTHTWHTDISTYWHTCTCPCKPCSLRVMHALHSVPCTHTQEDSRATHHSLWLIHASGSAVAHEGELASLVGQALHPHVREHSVCACVRMCVRVYMYASGPAHTHTWHSRALAPSRACCFAALLFLSHSCAAPPGNTPGLQAVACTLSNYLDAAGCTIQLVTGKQAGTDSYRSTNRETGCRHAGL